MTRESMIRLTGFGQVGQDTSVPRAFGMIGGFPVEASVPKEGALHLLISTSGLNRKAIRRLKDALSGKQGVKLVISEECTMFRVVLKSNDETEARNLFEQTKRQLESALADEKLFPPLVNCAICDEPGCDVLARVGHQLSPAHRTCLERQKHEVAEWVENKTNNPGTVQGLLGGLLGGIVGAAPAFIVLHMFDRFFFVLFALIPLGAYHGWKLFGGRMSRVTSVFVCIYSLLVAVSVDLIDTHLRLREIYAEVGLAGQIRLMDTINYYFTPSVFVEFFMRDTLLALGSAIAGIFCAWGFITKTDKGTLQEAVTAASEFVPIEREFRREETEPVVTGHETE